MSHDTRGVSAEFPSREAAHAAKDRLTRAGFARNSVDLYRRDDAYVVWIPTREENRRRAERALSGRAPLQAMGRGGGAALEAVGSNPALALGLAALAGFALFGLTRRRADR